MRKSMHPIAFCLLLIAAAARAGAADSLPAYTVERIELPGPIAGVAVKINLRDPRVHVDVALADGRDPDGDGPAVGLLDTPSSIARQHNFDITLNASFFKVLGSRMVNDKKIGYFVGNGAYPIGYHYSGGKLQTAPLRAGDFAQALIIHQDGKVTIEGALTGLPADTRFAVSGSRMMLTDGKITPPPKDEAREPRSAVGISDDGATLILLAIDGRQAGYSRGATMTELAQILIDRGMRNGLNLDGGGSTALILKDPGSGGFSVVNKPSDRAPTSVPFAIERPVVDVVGVRIDP